MMGFSAPEKVAVLDGKAENDSIELTWSRPEYPNGDIIAYKVSWNNGTNDCKAYLKTPKAADSSFLSSVVSPSVSRLSVCFLPVCLTDELVPTLLREH